MLFLLLAALVPADEPDAVRREALSRYGVGLLRARNDLPVQAIREFEAAAKADPTSPAPHRELVKLYADLGRYPAAIRAARKALELDPGDADTAHVLGKLLFDGKKFAEAVVALKQAADSPRTEPVKRFGILRDLARACEAADDPAGSEKALRAALAVATEQRAKLLKAAAYSSPGELDRAVAVVHERLGQVLVGQRKFSDATAEFHEAAKLFTAVRQTEAAARLAWNLSGSLAAEGQLEDALTQLNAFLKLKPSGAAPYERYANLLRRLNRGREIHSALARLVEANPANEAIRWVLASELAKDDPLAADRLFGETAERTADPELFRAWVNALKQAGRHDLILRTADRFYRAAKPEREDNDPNGKPPDADPKAAARAQSFTAAVRAEPRLSTTLIRRAADDAARNVRHHSDTWGLIAGLAERDGQLAEAERALMAAFQAGSTEDSFEPLYRVLTAQRKWTETLTFVDSAEQASRRRQAQRTRLYDFYRAEPLAELGRVAEAIIAADKMTRDASDPHSAKAYRLHILNILGRHKQAVAEGTRLLGEAHNFTEGRAVRLRLSEAYLGLKDFARAEAELRILFENDPDDALALNNLGYNLADQGRNLAEAEDMIRRAIALDRDASLRAGLPEPEKGMYLDSLGWVLFRRGKLAEARDLLEKAAASSDAGTDAVVWDHLGDVCFRLGDKAKAREAWGKAAELYVGSHTGRQQGRLDEVRRKLKQTE